MKQIVNQFTNGLVSDMHPLTTDDKGLVDALNATIITFNGNEVILQNDMGNTKIQDSKTGHIMGLSEGFIPVGMKEHGGIMYIASVNKEGKGEIGTIPSPIYTLSHQVIPDNWIHTLADEFGPTSKHSILNNHQLYPGDKFVVQLPLKTTTSPLFIYFYKNGQAVSNIDVLSHFDGSKRVKGLYDIKLYSVYGTGVTLLSDVMSSPQVYFESTLKNSKYWFINDSNIDLNLDVKKMYTGKLFKTYPGNIPPGRLAVRAELEGINSFNIIPVEQMPTAQQQKTHTPYIREIAGSPTTYSLEFAGFEYQLDSNRFIGKIEVFLYDQKTSQELKRWKFNKNGYYSVTADKLVNGQSNTIQIRNRSASDRSYYDADTAGTTYTPMFDYNIGTNLKNWYKITVKYYDLYDGVIGTYDHSFNPYHILHYKDSYYNIGWVRSNPIQQRLEPNAESETFNYTNSTTLTAKNLSVTFSANNRNYIQESTSSGYYQQVEYNSYKPLAEYIVNPGGWQNITANTGSVSGTIPKVDLQYLYQDARLTWQSDQFNASISISNGGLILPKLNTTGINFGIFTSTSDGTGWNGSYNDKTIYDSGHHSISSDQFGSSFSKKEKILQYVNSDKDHSINSTFSMNITSDLPFIDIYTEYDDKTGNITTDIFNILPIQISGYVDAGSRIVMKLDHQFTQNADYSIVPSFTLYGDHENESNVRLGFDRSGRAVKAWTVSKNYAQSVLRKSSGTMSSYIKSPEYIYPTDNIEPQILAAGTYIVNIQAPGQSNKNAKFSIEGVGDVIKFTNNGVDYFVPTIFHLSKPQVITFSWENITKFANIGIYQLVKPIVMNDGTIFGDDPAVNLLYYQDPLIKKDREPILPVCATYNEYATCLGKTYNYYSGYESAEYVQRHFIENTNGGVVTYVLESYVYTHDQKNPSNSAIVNVEGVPTTLNYRILNK